MMRAPRWFDPFDRMLLHFRPLLRDTATRDRLVDHVFSTWRRAKEDEGGADALVAFDEAAPTVRRWAIERIVCALATPAGHA